MRIFTCNQIKEIDSYTISNEPIPSIDLMERAAGKLYSWITGEFNRSNRFLIFTGPGNNGGDGLALARMLIMNSFMTEVYQISFSGKYSDDWAANMKRLTDMGKMKINHIGNMDHMPLISSDDIVIDAIFGSGLSRPVEGLAREVIREINQSDAVKISIDIPSGLFCEDNSNNDDEAVIRADFTLSFQFPKLAFMFSENIRYAGIWKVLPIGLHEKAIICNKNTI